MTQAHSRTVDTEAEVIEILIAISQVSARMARNLSRLIAMNNPRKEENIMSKMSEIAMTIEELRKPPLLLLMQPII